MFGPTSALTMGGCLVLVSAVVGSRMPGLAPVLLLLMATGLLLAIGAVRDDPVRIPHVTGTLAVGAAAALTGVSMFGEALGENHTVAASVAACLVVLLALLAADTDAKRRRSARSAMTVLILVEAAVLFTLVQSHGRDIDVLVFLGDGSQRLVSGTDPYLPGYPNIYPTEMAQLLYGPGVVGPDGRLTVGLPYPPASLLFSLPAHLLGDVRYAPLALLLGVALVMHRQGKGPASIPATLVGVAPGLGQMVLNGWTEAVIVALFGAALVAAHCRRWTMAAVLLALALVSKQYFVLTLPCLWLLREHATRRRLLAMAGAGTLVTVPFLVWHPAAFWRSIVEFQLLQPFRADSVSILTWTVNNFAWPGPAIFGVLPLTAGVITAMLWAWRARPGVDTFLVGTSLTLLVTSALSKQAFLNYYFLVGALLVLAAWSRAASDRPDLRSAHSTSSVWVDGAQAAAHGH